MRLLTLLLTTSDIPRTVKKIGVTLLLWTLKGLIGLKKCLTLLLFLVRNPFFWLCRAILNPVIALGYRVYRSARKLLSRLSEPMKDRAMSLLANRYAIHVSVLLLTFMVTATNLHAGNSATPEAEIAGHRSILAGIMMTEEEEVVVEEATLENVHAAEDVSYLGGQAISAHEQIDSGTDDGLYEDDAAELDIVTSALANAVRVQPRAETGDMPSTRTKVEEYVVQPGDNIGSIARTFGLRTETLLASNGLNARSLIRIGQVLKIIPVDGVLYKTRKGDTISKIASVYGSTVEKILEINGLSDASTLTSGMDLILPDGRLPAPPPPKPPSRIAKDFKKIFTSPAPDRVGSGQLLWPTAVRRITQYFRGRRHTGVDIAGPTGTPIYAADDGVVAISGWNRGGYGNMVIIDHGNGIYTRYAHNSKNLVGVGDAVKRGDNIALMGSTGRSTGPHIHFEVMSGNPHNRVNPLDYVR